MVDADDCDAREVNVVSVAAILALNNETVIVPEEVLETTNEQDATLLLEALCVVSLP